MNRHLALLIVWMVAGSLTLFGQSEGDVIINEIGNSGTQKNSYAGGDFVELLVLKPEGVNLAGWYLTDLSSPSGTPKATEGRVRFSDAERSIFRENIPAGTYVVVWLSSKDSVMDVAKQQEDLSLADGNNRIVVFAYDSPKQMDQQEGYINLTGKDNLVLLRSWGRGSAIDAISWGGTSRWDGCQGTQLPEEALSNGTVAWFARRTDTLSEFRQNTDPQFWMSSKDATSATPGGPNKGDDGSIVVPKKE